MHVYFALSPKTNRVKIGKAQDPESRLNHMQTGSPDVLELLLTLPNRPPYEEHQLHHRFAKYRIHREWVDYRGDLKSFISRKLKNPMASIADDAALAQKNEHHNPESFYTDDCQRPDSRPLKSEAYGLRPVWLDGDWDVWTPPSWTPRDGTKNQ